MNAVLLNDTFAWYHWGCTGTSMALREGIQARGYALETIAITEVAALEIKLESWRDFDDPRFFKRVYQHNEMLINKLSEASLVVVNGEGTLHGNSKGAVNLLYLTYCAARHLKKRVHLVNHSCYPDDKPMRTGSTAEAIYKAVYEKLDFVAIREKISHRLMTQLGIRATLSFDCLPIAIRKHYVQTVTRHPRQLVIAGSVQMSHQSPYYEAVANALNATIKQWHKTGYHIKLLSGANAKRSCDERLFESITSEVGDYCEHYRAPTFDKWLDCIASATALVSGRFHHTIAAISLGTPCVILESNTPKIAALVETAGLQTELKLGDPELMQSMCKRIEQVISQPSLADAAGKDFIALAERNFDGLRQSG